jgi:hypothetical protein
MSEIVCVSKKVYINTFTGNKTTRYSCGPIAKKLSSKWVLVELYHAAVPVNVSHDTLIDVDPVTIKWGTEPTRFAHKQKILCVCV